jgi:hypothetical protein
MDGKGRFLDNIFIERLWRSLKYEEVFIKAYRSVPRGIAYGICLTGPHWRLPGSGRIDSTTLWLVTTGGDDGRLHSLL